MRLPLTKIRTDGQTNARAGMDEKTLAEYADFMQSGSSFPPIVAFFDGTCYWLADGFHRVSAARRVGFREIEVELKAGNARDAMLYAVRANATHGLKRSPADKRRAISLLLADPEWSQWSDRAIAKASNTSHSFVAKVRGSLTGNKSSERKYQTKHGTTSVMDVSNIGTKPPSPPGWLGLKKAEGRRQEAEGRTPNMQEETSCMVSSRRESSHGDSLRHGYAYKPHLLPSALCLLPF